MQIRSLAATEVAVANKGRMSAIYSFRPTDIARPELVLHRLVGSSSSSSRNRLERL